MAVNKTRKPRSELTTVMCIMLLLMIFSAAGSYGLYVFRDTTAVKLIMFGVSGYLVYLFMHTFRLGPFKNRR